MKLGRERALRVAARLFILTALAGGRNSHRLRANSPFLGRDPALFEARFRRLTRRAPSPRNRRASPSHRRPNPQWGRSLVLWSMRRAPAVEPPKIARAATPAGSPNPASSTEVSVDERLRRMEEAYLRMEESNRRIQEQYGSLLRQYQDLSKSLRPSAEKDSTSKPSEKAPDDVLDSPNLAGFLGLDDQAGYAPPRITLMQQSGVGAQGRLGRGGQPSGPDLPEPLPAQDQPGGAGAGAGIQVPSGTRRWRERIRRLRGEPHRRRCRRDRRPREPDSAAVASGAHPGDGDIWVYKPDSGPPVHRAVVRFGEGLEFKTDDDEYSIQFHNLTQMDYRGFPTQESGHPPIRVLPSQATLVFHRKSHQKRRLLYRDQPRIRDARRPRRLHLASSRRPAATSHRQNEDPLSLRVLFDR